MSDCIKNLISMHAGSMNLKQCNLLKNGKSRFQPTTKRFYFRELFPSTWTNTTTFALNCPHLGKTASEYEIIENYFDTGTCWINYYEWGGLVVGLDDGQWSFPTLTILLFHDPNKELENNEHKNEGLNPSLVTMYNKRDPWNDYISIITTTK